MRLIVLALIVLPVAAHAEDRKFTVINHTGVTMTELYASPTTSDSWEENISEDDPLPHDGVRTITINDGREHCAYDIRAVFADEEELQDAVDVCHAEVLEMVDEPADETDKPAGQTL